ncbi:CAP domain-containing protein [Massilia psychrophila]|nr:CAP domain-containing protein [Massilia psychrophila]
MKNLFAKERRIALTRCALVCAMLFAAVAAHAQNPQNRHRHQSLADLINAYRAAPGSCEGRPAVPVAPLALEPALSRAQVASGMFLEQALERAGYPVARAEAIYVEGPLDEHAAMAAIASTYCRTLLSTQFSAIGAGRSGASWLVVLAQPAPPSPASQLAGWQQAGKAILDAVNAARSSARSCGEQQFAPAPALAWNAALADAALAHSLDMATHRSFSHQGKDGRVVGDRALQAGYRWRRIGENIASGQDSPGDAVAGWLSSPGHCANLMHRGFTDMGAAYAVDSARASTRVYWTQVFGTPH